MNKTHKKTIFTPVKKTVARYKMIEEGDRIAVGASGGKDSSSLLYILSALKRHLPYSFSVHAVLVHMGWQIDIALLEKFCKELGIPLHIEKTQIARVVFERKKEKNPCSLCAKLRRGYLHQAALKLGCNKVALGHHLDDALQTFFLNLIYTGNLSTFKPRTYLSKTGLTLIRPMVYLPQKTLLNLHRYHNLPVLENPCPAEDKTKRTDMEQLVNSLAGQYPGLHERFITAMENLKPEDFWYPLPRPRRNRHR